MRLRPGLLGALRPEQIVVDLRAATIVGPVMPVITGLGRAR
jgi:hypothetical protein